MAARSCFSPGRFLDAACFADGRRRPAPRGSGSSSSPPRPKKPDAPARKELWAAPLGASPSSTGPASASARALDFFALRRNATFKRFSCVDGRGTDRCMKGSNLTLFLPQAQHCFSDLSWPWKRSTMTLRFRRR